MLVKKYSEKKVFGVLKITDLKVVVRADVPLELERELSFNRTAAVVGRDIN